MMRRLRWFVPVAATAVLTLALFGQAGRGKTEIDTAAGKITIDYGRPELKGRDPLTWQKDGSYWRMGMNETTTLTTPVDLLFGSAQIAKGTYSLWLLKAGADSYDLVVNSRVDPHGMTHDGTKDVAAVRLKKEATSEAAEVLTIQLQPAPRGGTFVMTWGTIRLSAGFQVAM
jgi:hypothetical protein